MQQLSLAGRYAVSDSAPARWLAGPTLKPLLCRGFLPPLSGCMWGMQLPRKPAALSHCAALAPPLKGRALFSAERPSPAVAADTLSFRAKASSRASAEYTARRAALQAAVQELLYICTLHRGTADGTAVTEALQARWPHTLVVGISQWLHAVKGACPQADIWHAAGADTSLQLHHLLHALKCCLGLERRCRAHK